MKQADWRKDKFLTVLAHELRNLLVLLCSAVQVSRLRDMNDPDLQRAMDVIDLQAQQMARPGEDLLDTSCIAQGKLPMRNEPVNLAAIIARAVEASRSVFGDRKQRLEVTPHLGPVRVLADPIRLVQVLQNLLNNASKYTEVGGRIRLTVAKEEYQVVIRVRDFRVCVIRAWASPRTCFSRYLICSPKCLARWLNRKADWESD